MPKLLSPLLSLLVVLAGCDQGRTYSGPSPAASKTSSDHRRPLVTHIDSVATIDGQILIEIPAGHRHHLQDGDLLRVYGATAQAPLKGMLQIQDVIDDERSLCRQIGLYDRNQPLAVDDEVRLVRSLSLAADSNRLEDDIERERNAAIRADNEDDKAFTGVRTHYRNQLDAIEQRHRDIIARLDRAHDQTVIDLQASHQRELERQAASHQADIATVRATLHDEAQAQVRLQTRALEAANRELEVRNHQLEDRVASLIRDGKALQQRIIALHNDVDNLRQRHASELTAEVETREVLQQRLSELERRLAGRAAPTSVSVLTADARRNETVLERLTRISSERDQALTHCDDLKADLALGQQQHKRDQARITELTAALSSAEQTHAEHAALIARLTAAEEQLQRHQTHATTSALHQLQAERSYYDLAARLLRLESDDPLITDLQQRLRLRLSDQEAP
ncbi:MAG: hypothetical protein ACYTF0_05125 [Planctomycetota bacterium]